MPAGDGTGPQGTGGRCTPLWRSGQIPQPTGRPMGYGGGGGFGRGRGYRNVYRATGLPYWARMDQTTPHTTTQEPQQTREQEIQQLKQELSDIKKRLNELQKQ
ncbi:MAG: hypothetical protein B6U97_00215 [Candidatus Altiarchaeales archaeon ex4484_96]|nr:MAG: hypothetical protein B6U97_00215 [Candidatus Altiarchaeales archaeon ex4484_96]